VRPVTELAAGHDTRRLPVNGAVLQAMLHAITGRDVLADLLPDNP
jgi:hypothetical protein